MSFSTQQFISFFTLAIVMSITPGPNNIMILFSSVKFGLKATLPSILGASLGSALMLFLVGIGFHQILIKYHIIFILIKYLGIFYILYLAWKISFDKGQMTFSSQDKPMQLFHSILFQWINPKAWIMSSVAVTTCLPSGFNTEDIIFYSCIFILISFPCVWIWGGFGSFFIKHIENLKFIRIFNHICSSFLLISVFLMFLSNFHY